jgi:hypothetical protein
VITGPGYHSEVNSLKVDGDSVNFIPHEILGKFMVVVLYQLLCLCPASSDDNPTSTYDWHSCRTKKEQSFTVAGSLIQPINPDLPQNIGIGHEYYILNSQVLVALTASLLTQLTTADAKNIPRVVPAKDFPYHKQTGISIVCS